MIRENQRSFPFVFVTKLLNWSTILLFIYYVERQLLLWKAKEGN